jgi:hypothetical protein
MNMTRLSTLIALLALALMIAVPAVAQDYPIDDDEPEATVSQTVVVPGQPVVVSGEDWLPNSTVTIEFLSTPVLLGTASVDANGRFSRQVTIPSNATPGPHTIRVSGFDTDNLPRVVNIPITVAAAAAAPAAPAAPVTPGTALARTGGYLTTAGSMAVLLLVIGGGALFASRRLGKVAA